MKLFKKKTSRIPVRNRGSRTKLAAAAPAKLWRRWLWYINPKRFRDYWFTREGRIAALKIAGVAVATGFILVVGLFLYFAKDLPSPGQLNRRALAQTTRFYDRTGEHLLYEVFGDQNRTFVELGNISPDVKDATIAIEDKNFYKQGAFSSIGILRAAYNNFFNRGSGLQGGSTITQQFVKNSLLTSERSYARKIKEIIISLQIEQLYKKDDILEMYLNEIPYGAQAYGVQAASQMFFSKDAKDVTLDEAAMLAALPQAPTYYSPYGQNPQDLIERQHIVLDLMAEQGYITAEEAVAAKEVDTMEKVNDTPQVYENVTAPHFVLYVQQQLEEKFSPENPKLVTEGGLEVITTLDLEKQKMAEEAIKAGIGSVEAGGGNNAALVASDPNTGQMLAMVGSRDFNYPKYGAFNAALAQRQPGSSFKPYVYASAFESGDWGPGSVMYDVGTDFGDYRPNNFDNRFRGAMSIRSALAESRNIPAVKMLYIVGVQTALDKAHAMGITTLQEDPSNYGLSLVLGAGEVQLNDHVNAYETFANGGTHRDPTTILKVTDARGNVLEEYKESDGKKIFEPTVPYMISNILSDSNARSPTFGASARFMTIPGKTVAVKTGTTDENRDGWMIGYSKDIVAGVWIGNNDNRPMYGITSAMTGPIWHGFMEKALADTENKPFERPAGIKDVTLDTYTGNAPTSATRRRHTDIFPASYQISAATGTRTATIDTVSNKLATDCTPRLARKEVTGVGLTAEIPPSDPAYGRWNPPVQALARSLGLGEGGPIPTEKDDVHKCNDKKPTVTLTAEQDGEEIIIKYDVTKGTFAPEKLDIKYNDQIISSITLGNKLSGQITYKPKKDGSYSFTATVTDKGLYTGEDKSNSIDFKKEDEPGNNGNGEGNGILDD